MARGFRPKAGGPFVVEGIEGVRVMSTFEVAVYNKTVRDKLKAGDRHRELNDDWADIHYIELKAEDTAEARRKAEVKFPADQGFVIEAVTPA